MMNVGTWALPGVNLTGHELLEQAATTELLSPLRISAVRKRIVPCEEMPTFTLIALPLAALSDYLPDATAYVTPAQAIA